jgi:hypothetical protein
VRARTLALFVVALASCRPSAAPRPAERAAPLPRPAGAAPSFAAVTKTRGLWPGMTLDEARRALGASGMAAGEHAGNARPPHWLKAASGGWTGTLYLDAMDRTVVQILFQSPEVADEAEAKAIVDGLVARFGPPASSRRVEGRDGTFVETFDVWSNDAVKLEVDLHESRSSAAKATFTVFESWTRSDRAR